jgi:farnesyl diphosphate synthase/geranylgeranyl diphosphate synthase type II
MAEAATARVATVAAAPGFGAERAAVDAALEAMGGRYLAAISPTAVADAVHYALTGGGKRLRAMLVLSAYRAAGGTGDATLLAAAVEVVHAYSLVHDDLPCMDDDAMRRGRPTVHVVYGVPAATAAGLAMVPLAAQSAADACASLGLDDGEARRVVSRLMCAAGGGGMIGGQLLDLEGEGRDLDLADLERIHRLKTGALITASAVLGALAARADARVVDAFDRYGRAIGLAFQIADDVLDVTATTDQLGKTAGKDLVARKSTYPAVLGVAGAVKRASALVDQACAALADVGLLTPELEHLARFIVARRS